MISDDKESFVRRLFFNNHKNQKGSINMKNEKMRVGINEMYYASFSQLEMSPDDVNSNCVNYPTKIFASYADCDQEFLRDGMPDGLVPFWILPMENMSQASNNFSMKSLHEISYTPEKFLAQIGKKKIPKTF